MAEPLQVPADAGGVDDLRREGAVVTKVGRHGVCVFWHDERPYAVDDRCPHLGFPLHRGSIEDGLLTCHWHHARFDLASGGTLDPFADDVRTYPVEVVDGRVLVGVPATVETADPLLTRLDEGLEQGLTLVLAKAVLGLIDAGVPSAEVIRRGVAFGTAHRGEGWGAGLTVLVAMANLIDQLDPADRALALVHGLTWVSRDTRGHPDRFGLAPLGGTAIGADRLERWYRRFVGTRATDAAERTLATALGVLTRPEVERIMFAAASDHVFVDEGHTVDFTNKAFECLDHLGWDAAAIVTSLVAQTAHASRSEEGGSWRHPDDLAALAAEASERILAGGTASLEGRGVADQQLVDLAWHVLDDDPTSSVEHLLVALAQGATPEQLGRAVALAAGLRVTRFGVQNDHGDWDVVHHGFTYANAVHQALRRAPSVALLRAVVHGALRVHLDRFLNIPAARVPSVEGNLAALADCWDREGQVDRAGGIVHAWIREGGDPRAAVARLGRALLAEDAGFHWFQIVEAAARQGAAWPAGSEPQALLLAGAARFVAAHTPTRRELPQVVRIAQRLRRGDDLFAEG